jgi:hypothetical protein
LNLLFVPFSYYSLPNPFLSDLHQAEFAGPLLSPIHFSAIKDDKAFPEEQQNASGSAFCVSKCSYSSDWLIGQQYLS